MGLVQDFLLNVTLLEIKYCADRAKQKLKVEMETFKLNKLNCGVSSDSVTLKNKSLKSKSKSLDYCKSVKDSFFNKVKSISYKYSLC